MWCGRRRVESAEKEHKVGAVVRFGCFLQHLMWRWPSCDRNEHWPQATAQHGIDSGQRIKTVIPQRKAFRNSQGHLIPSRLKRKTHTRVAVACRMQLVSRGCASDCCRAFSDWCRAFSDWCRASSGWCRASGLILSG